MQGNVRHAAALAALTIPMMVPTIFIATPANAAITTAAGSAGALAIATAVAGPGAAVTGASFLTVPPAGTPNGVADAPLSVMPTNDTTFGILTTGNVALADDANVAGNTSAHNGGGPVPGRGDTALDVSVLKVDLDVPAGANCLTVDFAFYSEEFQEFVGSQFNDAFIAELDTSSWTTSGSTISAPDNFAFDPSGDVISINSTGATAMTAAKAAGTTYDGGTSLLAASTAVTPGAHSLYLSIFDQADTIYDSAVFLDNLVVGFVPNASTQCVPGAKPVDNTPPTVEAGGPYTGTEGSPVAISATANDAESDDLTGSWTATPTAAVDAGAACSFADASAASTTITCTDDGEWTLTYTANETASGGLSGSDTATLTLGNADPVVTSVSVGTDPVAVTSPVTASATFTDAGSNDEHTGQWNWGDGSTSPAVLSAGNATGSHTYAEAGIYTICFTVADDDSGSGGGCATTFTVVFDPTAGFVTGGGHLQSPPGAYTPEDSTDADLVGRANFGFVSKYKKGATTPTGNTQFQFQAGDLNFSSTSYEWLVVSGAKATYRGVGTVNGTGEYSFQLSALDGQQSGGGGADRLRMKIIDRSTGVVLYDNQVGSTDDAVPSTAISGGSIVIHTGK